MKSIRIAIATALVLAVLFAGGGAHTSRAHASAAARPPLAGGPMRNSPVLCC